MITADDDQLAWSVDKPDRNGKVSVTVRHPSAVPYIGWAYRKGEQEARDKALERLNYAAEGYEYYGGQ